MLTARENDSWVFPPAPEYCQVVAISRVVTMFGSRKLPIFPIVFLRSKRITQHKKPTEIIKQMLIFAGSRLLLKTNIRTVKCMV